MIHDQKRKIAKTECKNNGEYMMNSNLGLRLKTVYAFVSSTRTVFTGMCLKVITLFSFLIFQTACESLVEVDPPVDAKNSSNVFTDDLAAAAAITGIYAKISRDNYSSFRTGGFTSVSLFAALSADELTLYNVADLTYTGYYRNALSRLVTVGTANYWNTLYPIIFVANSAIEGIDNSTSLTLTVKRQLLGEAKFMRAFCYFYLINFYGDVPLALSTDWKVNAALARTPKAQVYAQIISDLRDAQNLMSANYLAGDALKTTTERVRPNKWVATAMLARAYLYTGDWANAEAQATSVITGPFNLGTLNSTFLKNSAETIWALQSVGTGSNANTGEGKIFVLPATGPTSTYPVYLSNNHVNSFESGDQRRIDWIDSVTVGTTTYYYAHKYKVGTVSVPNSEYSMIMRLAEQYLIRAEARAQLGNVAGAAADLNAIRNRAGLANTTAATQSALLSAIEQERRVELFTEWGHRWLDLKRWNTIDAVMSVATPQKGGTWEITDQLYPIMQDELNKNPKLVQNPGY